MVRAVRGAVERIYAAHDVESVNYLLRTQIMSSTRTVLSAMLNIKAFICLEPGRLGLIDEARTQAQSVDRLVAFVTELVESKRGLLQVIGLIDRSLAKTVADIPGHLPVAGWARSGLSSDPRLWVEKLRRGVQNRVHPCGRIHKMVPVIRTRVTELWGPCACQKILRH